MNSRELQIAVTNLLRSADYPDEVPTQDVYQVLSEAQEQLLRESFEHFEETRIVTDDLQALVKRDASLAAAATFTEPDGHHKDTFTLPNDFGYYIGAQAALSWNPGGLATTITANVRTPQQPFLAFRRLVRFVQSDDVYRLLADPFGGPSYREPVAVIGGGVLGVFTDATFAATALYLDYLQVPLAIELNTPPTLPLREHYRLVELTTSLFMQRRLKKA